jgi:signal transduction histidine kinase/CHASE2 domain-containing sensor protein
MPTKLWSLRQVGWRLLPGSIAALISLGWGHVGGWLPFEQFAYRGLMQTRGQIPWDDRLAIITIDDASLNQLGRFPWPRQTYATLLDQLAKGKPSVVGIDLIFSEPSPEDAKLAAAMSRFGRVVLATGDSRTGQPLLPVPPLKEAAIAMGHINYYPDVDGITRRLPLYHQSSPAFGLALVQSYGLVHEAVPLPQTAAPLWLNWLGPVEKAPDYSFVDVMKGTVPPQVFENKIVIVGVTASAFDPLMTPFNASPPASGVHLQATLVHNLLQQNSLIRPPAFVALLAVALGAPLLGLWLGNRAEKNRWLLWLLLSVGWAGISILAFQERYWLPVAMPIGTLTLTAIAAAAGDRWHSYRLMQQHTQRLQQTYPHSPLSLAPPLSQTLSPVQQLAALAEQFGQLQLAQMAITHSLTLGIIATDLHGRVWFCNPLAREWLQLDVGARLNQCLVPQWLSLEQWNHLLQTLPKTGSATYTVHRGDRWFNLRFESLRPPVPPNPETVQPGPPLESAPNLATTRPAHSGNRVGYVLVVEDITHQAQTADQLEQEMATLQAMSQAKDHYLNLVAHELRSPMSNIQMAIELMKTAPLPQMVQQYLAIVQDESTRELDLINDLLDLQRLEAGAHPFNPEAIPLQRWLPTLLEPFGHRAQLQEQTLQIQLAPHLPTVIADEASLQRVVSELVHNACKYTPPGETITVAAAIVPLPIAPEAATLQNGKHIATDTPPPAPVPSDQIQITVANSGVEIPSEDLPHIFEKFYRVPQIDLWKRGGTGLGLSLVKTLVERLGGTIEASSTHGQTRFTVKLPAPSVDVSRPTAFQPDSFKINESRINEST